MGRNYKLANVVFYLASTARTWFENHEEELNDWKAFRDAISSTFSVAHNRTRFSLEKLSTRAQLEGESFTSYIEDVLWLCRKANPLMDEAEKLSHLMKGVAEDAFQLLVLKDPTTVVAFSDACKKFEEAQKNRLKQMAYHRLPNVAAASFLPLPPSGDLDIRTIIKEAVREELRAIFKEHPALAYSPLFSEPPLPDNVVMHSAVSQPAPVISSECAHHQSAVFGAATPFGDCQQTHPKIVASYSEAGSRPHRSFEVSDNFRYQPPRRPTVFRRPFQP